MITDPSVLAMGAAFAVLVVYHSVVSLWNRGRLYVWFDFTVNLILGNITIVNLDEDDDDV